MSLRRAGGSDLAARIFGRGTPQALALLRTAWPRAVGLDLARRTELLAIEGRTLRVKVPDARWRKVLHRMQPELLARLRDLAGDLAPRRIGFSEGPVAQAPLEAPAAHADAPPLAPLPESVATQARAIADPETRARFERSAALYLDVFRKESSPRIAEAGSTPAEAHADRKCAAKTPE